MENLNKIDTGDEYFVPLNLGQLGSTNTTENEAK
jgi:hypothetical protein